LIINLLNPLVTGNISESITDAEVIEKYLASSNSHYFNLLYDRYSRKVYAKCISLLKDQAWAEDATQDIFMKILLKIGDFSGKSKFSTWLYSITYNYCIDLLRKRKKDPSVLVEDFGENDDIEDSVEDSFLMETSVTRLKVILGELPVSDKSVLLMKYQDEMSIKEMCDVFDKSESAIKMKIKRAKEKFVRIYNQKYMTA
jgi:RNA polymerase sigma-70 factor (ECF subfamily)